MCKGFFTNDSATLGILLLNNGQVSFVALTSAVYIFFFTSSPIPRQILPPFYQAVQ